MRRRRKALCVLISSSKTVFSAVLPAGGAPQDLAKSDLREGMVWPCFADIHTHLDKGHIWATQQSGRNLHGCPDRRSAIAKRIGRPMTCASACEFSLTIGLCARHQPDPLRIWTLASPNTRISFDVSFRGERNPGGTRSRCRPSPSSRWTTWWMKPFSPISSPSSAMARAVCSAASPGWDRTSMAARYALSCGGGEWSRCRSACRRDG